MFEYITKTFSYISKALKYFEDSKDPFKAGDLEEVREMVEYKEKRPRAKAISSGKYAKNKGEKVPQWRRRIIPRYNELKQRRLNPESKYYTTARINNFIKEIEEIESKFD